MSGEFFSAGAAIGSVPIGGHRFMLPGVSVHHNQGHPQMNVLRQATAIDVLVGPFLNDIDGNTKQTGLTIAAADVLLSKNGQALTLKADVTSCVHDAAGNYNCELDATDTGTVGTLVLTVHVAGALAVRHEFQVLEEAVYDDLYTGSATGYPTVTEITADMDGNSTQLAAIVADTNELQVDDTPGALAALDVKIDAIDTVVDAILVDTSTTLDAQLAAIAAYLDTEIAAILVDTGTTLPGLIATLQADTDDIQTRLPAALVSGLMSCDITAISTSTTAADLLELSTLSIVSGIATGTPTTTTMAASALTEATNDHYVGRTLLWTSGAAKDIAGPISDYDGTTKTFTFIARVTACAAADTFIII